MKSIPIDISLNENPFIPLFKIPKNVKVKIAEAIADSVAADKALNKTKTEKSISKRYTQEAIAALLQNSSLTRSELLSVSGTENISSIVIRIKNALKSTHIYTLKKQGKGDNTIYYLEKIKTD